MTIEQALRKALEAGYVFRDCVQVHGIGADGLYEFRSSERAYFVWPEQFLTDPEFWQSLGKHWDGRTNE